MSSKFSYFLVLYLDKWSMKGKALLSYALCRLLQTLLFVYETDFFAKTMQLLEKLWMPGSKASQT